MNTPTEFYKKLLAYKDDLNLDEASPLTHKGVIHFITEYSNQLHKHSVMQAEVSASGAQRSKCIGSATPTQTL